MVPGNILLGFTSNMVSYLFYLSLSLRYIHKSLDFGSGRLLQFSHSLKLNITLFMIIFFKSPVIVPWSITHHNDEWFLYFFMFTFDSFSHWLIHLIKFNLSYLQGNCGFLFVIDFSSGSKWISMKTREVVCVWSFRTLLLKCSWPTGPKPGHHRACRCPGILWL